MSDQQAAILRTADVAKVAQAALTNIIFELPAVALCNEIEHHLSTGTISFEAPRDVDLAIDASPREGQTALGAVAKPDAILRMMRPEAFCQLIQFRLGSLDNHHFTVRSE